MLNTNKSKMSIYLVEKPVRQTSATMEMVAHTQPANIGLSETLEPVVKYFLGAQDILLCQKSI